MPELSVIIPYVNEWPTAPFTIMNIAEELRDRVDFELIAVNNYCEEHKQRQKVEDDRVHNQLKAVNRGHPWLKPLHYQDKLSHWQAKNTAVQASSGEFLWFCDSHCIISRDSLFDMFNFYKKHHPALKGTMHLPLTYHIVEYHRLIYKLVENVAEGVVDYSFTPFRESNGIPYEVPVMSCCGVMMTRELYDEFGGWPVELGIYGGGEQFLNFTLAVMGKSKWIFPAPPLRHHGDNRGYSYVYDDMIRNKMIAAYVHSGEEFVRKFADHLHRAGKGKKEVLHSICNNVIEKCQKHRQLVKAKSVISISDWVKKWKA